MPAKKKPAKRAVKKKAKSRVNEAGNYTKPAMRKRMFEEIKASGKGGKPDNGLLGRRRCWRGVTKRQAEGTRTNG